MHTKTHMCGALCDLLVAVVATSGQKPAATIGKPTSGQDASTRGSPLAQLGGRWFELVDAAPSLRGDCAVHLRYDSWNLCVRSFGGSSPESPLRGGGVWEIGLKDPPHLELQWIPGPMAAGFAGRLVRMATMHLATRLQYVGRRWGLGCILGRANPCNWPHQPMQPELP